jgi:antitoxin Phd
MKSKVQERRQRALKLAKPLHGATDQRRPDMAESLGPRSESARYIPASEAKNRFATVLENVSRGQEVFITKHNTPKAVVISVERFRALTAQTTSVLDRLTAEFDARLERMQTPRAHTALEKAFNASASDLGKAALRMARSKS